MDEYKAKIEVVLGNDNRADMTLNGNINDLLNLMADVMAQTIVDFFRYQERGGEGNGKGQMLYADHPGRVLEQ